MSDSNFINSPVIAARDFFYDDNDLDFHSDYCRIYMAGRILPRLFRDGYNFFNKFSSVNWYDTGTPGVTITNKCDDSFTNIAIKRAHEIASKYKDINLLWSGGTDSNGVLAAFATLPNKSNIKVICTESAVKEVPEFYQKIKSNFKFIILQSQKEIFPTLDIVGGVAISGLGAEVDYYNFYGIDKGRGADLANSPWKDAFVMLCNDGVIKIKNTTEAMADVLQEYADVLLRCGVNIKTYKQLMHVFRLSAFDWSFGCLGLDSIAYRAESPIECIPFFFSEEFEQWSLTHLDVFNTRDMTLPCNYKAEIKDIVTRVLGPIDEIIAQEKSKRTSWQFINGSPRLSTRVVVKTTNNTLCFDNPGDFYANNEFDKQWNVSFSNLVRREFFTIKP